MMRGSWKGWDSDRRRKSGREIGLGRSGLVLGAFLLAAALPACAQSEPKSVLLLAPAGREARAHVLSQTLALPEGVRFAAGAEAELVLRWVIGAPSGTPDAVTRLVPRGAALRWDSPVDSVAAPPEGDWEEAVSRAGAVWADPEAVEPPLRLAALGGRWPGEDGYPIQETWTLEGQIPKAWRELWKTPRGGSKPFRLVWIGAGGDIMPGRGAQEILLSQNGPRRGFGRALDFMTAQDLFLANLETAVTLRGEKQPKSYNFRVSPQVLGPLRAAGIDWVSIANNHSRDWGERGFLDTLDALEQAGLPTSGAGRDLDEALVPSSFDPAGLPVKVWALGAYPDESKGYSGLREAAAGPGRPGILWAEPESLALLHARLGEAAGSFRIVVVHGGDEWVSLPSAAQARLYRGLIDAGADLVFAHHPHVVQPLEVRNGKLIFYSLGNYLFNGMEDTLNGTYGLLSAVGVQGGKIRALRFASVLLDGPRVDLDPQGRAQAQLVKLSREWEKLGR